MPTRGLGLTHSPDAYDAEPNANAPRLPCVRIEQAFRWHCPACARENFDRAQVVRFDNQALEREAREALGVPHGCPGGVVAVPRSVTCGGCLAMFRPGEERR